MLRLWYEFGIPYVRKSSKSLMEGKLNHPVPIKGAADLAPRVWHWWKWAIIYAANEWEIDRAAISNLYPGALETVEFVTARAATLVCLFAPLRGRCTRSLSDKTKGQHIWVGVNAVMPNLHSPTYLTVLVPRYTFYGPE